MKIDDFPAALSTYLNDTGISQISFAKQIDGNQSQVSDWIKGKLKRSTPSVRRAMTIIEKHRRNEQPLPSVIDQAVRMVWNGTDDSAVAIAKVIESLAGFR